MPLSCTEIIEAYVSTLTSGFRCSVLGDRLRLITPYTYPDNDLIQVFVEQIAEDRIRISDLGETVRHLHSQGFDVNAVAKRKEMARTIAAGMEVEFAGGELTKEGNISEVGDLILSLVTTARGVSDLIYTTRTYEPATFLEEVGMFLSEHDIDFESDTKLTGETGRTYKVNYLLHPSSTYLQTLSPRQPAGLQPVVNRVFRMWFDCNGNLGKERKYSVLNDIDFEWRSPEIILLQRVSVVSLWSQREELLRGLRS